MVWLVAVVVVVLLAPTLVLLTPTLVWLTPTLVWYPQPWCG